MRDASLTTTYGPLMRGLRKVVLHISDPLSEVSGAWKPNASTRRISDEAHRLKELFPGLGLELDL